MEDTKFKTIRDLIALGQTEAALDALAELLSKNTSDTDFRDECLKIQSQQFRLKQERIRGTLSADESARQQNQINHRLFELLSQIERGEKPGSLSFQKQNPLLFYALHVVASLTICGLLGYFVNDGFVSGREEWKSHGIISEHMAENFAVLIIGIVPCFFALLACFQFIPFLLGKQDEFTRLLTTRYYFLIYGNAIYYIIPTKFLLFHRLVTHSFVIFFYFTGLVFGFCLCVYIFFRVVFFLIRLNQFADERLGSFSHFMSEIPDDADNFFYSLLVTIARDPVSVIFGAIISFFAYYAIGHPIAVTIYNFL